MAVEPFCEFGQLPVAQCAHCREASRLASGPPWSVPEEDVEYVIGVIRAIGLEALRDRWRGFWAIAFGPEEDWEAMAAIAERSFGLGPWFLAEYDSKCKGCGEPVYLGDTVRYSDDEGGIVCLDCGAEGE